jgi:predicted metal-dependent peptidase
MLLRAQHPFFGTLALYANIRIDTSIKTAATDGESLFFNPDFISNLNRPELLGLIVHEVLHMALLHNQRRGTRDSLMWNIAADIVVNGMITKLTTYSLPDGAVQCLALSHLSAEEVYEQLPNYAEISVNQLTLIDLLPEVDRLKRDHETNWKMVISQAKAISVQHGKGIGHVSLGLFREFDVLAAPPLSWQELLWSLLVATPCDFQGYDRRFIWNGLYLDAMAGESLRVAIAIDTSDSVSKGDLSLFVAEVKSILATYPHISAELYYCDTHLFGPYELDSFTTVPPPKGGGGTSFEPFFKRIADAPPDLAIYFTDGHALFPRLEPKHEILWVITQAGIESDAIPFGTIARMNIHN